LVTLYADRQSRLAQPASICTNGPSSSTGRFSVPVGRIAPDILQILDFYSVEAFQGICRLPYPSIYQMLT
jgi:hypothetical protein